MVCNVYHNSIMCCLIVKKGNSIIVNSYSYDHVVLLEQEGLVSFLIQLFVMMKQA